GIRAALEPMRGLRVHAEGLGPAADGGTGPAGPLERERAAGVRDLARRAAHDPGQAERAAHAADDADPALQRALLAVQGHDLLPRAVPAPDDPSPRHSR